MPFLFYRSSAPSYVLFETYILRYGDDNAFLFKGDTRNISNGYCGFLVALLENDRYRALRWVHFLRNCHKSRRRKNQQMTQV